MDIKIPFMPTVISTSSAIATSNQYYDKTCADDAECGQLQRIFLRAFVLEKTQDGLEKLHIDFKHASEDLMDQFADTIHPLVRRISRRLDPTAVHCVWMQSAQAVAKSWSGRLTTFKGDLDVLRYLLTAWHAYQNAINLIHSLTVYAQWHILAGNAARAPPNTQPRSLINEMCCAIFVEHFLGTSNEHVFKSITAVIKSDVKQVDTVKAVLQLLLCLDANQTVYYRVFAFPYLAALRRAYCGEPTITDADAAISYLKQVERTIEDEITTANEYGFTPPLTRMIGKLLYVQLIATHRKQVCSDSIFAELLQGVCHQQLWYLYQVVKYDAESVKLLAAIIERYLSTELGAIQLLDSKNTREETFKFVQDLNQLYLYWLDGVDSIANRRFPNCTEARQAMTAAFSEYLNSEPIYSCLLSLYVHFTSSTCSWSMDPAIKLLALVQDKPVVTEYARYFLCNRIVQQLSLEPEKDVAAIGRVLESLQIESPFSVKLILKNYKASVNQLKDQSLVRRYRQSFQIRLLNGLWKLELDTDSATQTFRLPRSFWAMYNSFRHDFVSVNPKKILQLNRNYGSAKLLAHFDSRQTTYKFMVSLRQAVILLLFNRHTSLTFEQLQTRAKIDTESLRQCVKLFLKYGLLQVKSEEGQDETDRDLTEGTFEIDDKFSHCGVDKTGLAISIKKLEKEANSNSTGIVQINWIKLQYECNPNFDLVKIMTKCTGDSLMDESVCAPAVPVSNHQDTSNEPNDKEVNQAEANSPSGTFRIEAAVVRVLKRATVVADLKMLRDLTLDALVATTWTGRRKSPHKLASSVPMVELKKCVDSLEKNGYLCQLPGGEIVYEP